MVYDRRYGDKTLNFEPSGGLLKASLVMRDRETDSWWPIMLDAAIGGPMKGAPLRELPVSEKARWGDWRRRHPATLVLVDNGKTHEPLNHYDRYFTSDETFRNTRVEDDRLPPKTPIYAFRVIDRAYAATAASLEGGALLDLGGGESRQAVLYRRRGASVFESTTAFLVPRGVVTIQDGALVVAGKPLDLGASPDFAPLERLPGVERIAGTDTYWYTWVAVNGKTVLLGK